jgi:hypothetical protein
MATEDDFLAEVLPSTGPFIYWTRQTQAVVDTQTDLIAECQRLSAKGWDAYFATASYIDKTAPKPRHHTNVKYKKTFNLDLDCGSGKSYATQTEALAALKVFIADTGMPMPTWIILSGYGIHVYWALTKTVKPDPWREVAGMLKAACINYGLKADHGVTADVTRVMRIPGTYNFKDKTSPKPVQGKRTGEAYPLLRYKTCLSKHTTAAYKVLNHIPGSLNAELGGGMGYAPRYAKHIAPECLVLRDALDTGGKDHEEPMWSSLLHLLAFCEDGEDFIHEIGNKHTGYTAQSTVVKFNAKLASKSSTGPTTCAHFAALSPLCQHCKYNGVETSPIGLGLAPIDPDTPPNPWLLKPNGVFVNDPEAGPVRVIKLALTKVELFAATGQGESMMLGFHTNSLKTGKAQPPEYIPVKVVQDAKELHRSLPDHNITLEKDDAMQLSRMGTAWAAQLNNAGKAKNYSRRFGWVKSGKTRGFMAGGVTYWEDGTHEDTNISDQTLQSYYTPEGLAQPWIDCADTIIGRGDMAINCAVATAFAAPLIKFTGISGTTVAIVSHETGTGKTTALKLAAAVNGDPTKVINSLNDTHNSVVEKLSICNSLPAFWDEVRMVEDPKRFVADILFRLSEGKNKGRLGKDLKILDTRTWNTLMCLGSNESMLEMITDNMKSSNAGAVRLLELVVRPLPTGVSTFAATKQLGALGENYGVIGQKYAEYMVNNIPTITKLLDGLTVEFNKSVPNESDERFRIAACVTLLVGAALANKCGFTKFPLKKMKAYLLNTLSYSNDKAAQKAASGVMDLPDIVEQYISDCGRHIYHTDYVPITAAAAQVGVNQGFGSIVTPDPIEPLKGVYGIKDNHIRIHAGYIGEWCTQHGISKAVLRSEAAKHPAFTGPIQRRLGVGLICDRKAKPAVYDIDLNQLRGVTVKP